MSSVNGSASRATSTTPRTQSLGEAAIAHPADDGLRNPTHILVISDRSLIDLQGSEEFRRQNLEIRGLMTPGEAERPLHAALDLFIASLCSRPPD